jgi:hypothetical protein
MGRRSRAQSLITEHEEMEDSDEMFIVVYDFHDLKPSKKFWHNLRRISQDNEGTGLIQYSVYKAQGIKEALIVSKLAESYGAESLIFQAEEYTR